jgi:hypothetical protein
MTSKIIITLAPHEGRERVYEFDITSIHHVHISRGFVRIYDAQTTRLRAEFTVDEVVDYTQVLSDGRRRTKDLTKY